MMHTARQYSECFALWTPTHFGELRPNTAGQIKIGPKDRLRSLWGDYFYKAGGAFRAESEPEEEITSFWELQVFLDFHTCVVRDGIDPDAAHREFLNVEEYRRLISPDIEGASP